MPTPSTASFLMGSPNVIIYRSGKTEVVGLHDRVDRPRLPAGTRAFGIRLRPQVVGRFLGTTASDLRNVTVALVDVVGTRAARRVFDEDQLDSWIVDFAPDPALSAAVFLLGAGRSVSQAANVAQMSTRHLRRRFLREIGLSPKRYAQIARLQRFLRLAKTGSAGLAEVAATAGYSDQSHLNREARGLSGLTPRELVLPRSSTPR